MFALYQSSPAGLGLSRSNGPDQLTFQRRKKIIPGLTSARIFCSIIMSHLGVPMTGQVLQILLVIIVVGALMSLAMRLNHRQEDDLL